MKNGDKVKIYGADNKWHEAIYIGRAPEEGHHIVYKDGKPWEGAFVKPKK